MPASNSGGLLRELKMRFFRATVESVLLHGSKRWMLTDAFSKRLEDAYTRQQRSAFNMPWKQHLFR